MPNEAKCDRAQAMRRVQICSFALLEAALYLDTHPDDPEALDYFAKYHQLLERAEQEYEANFGPLHLRHSDNELCWDWVSQPWPWEVNG